MNAISKIKEPVAEEFALYEEYMKSSLKSDYQFIEGIMGYIFGSRGKGVRPILTLLFASLHAYPSKAAERARLSAMLVEMIHSASLVHDDVIDESLLRHGKPTVNAKWNSRISVLAGDFILARSFAVGMESGHYDLVAYIMQSITELAEGELLQNDRDTQHNMTLELYLEIISKKTASLMGASCGSGALASNAPAEEVEKSYGIGANLGMAFQIKDDILDYSPEEKTGKTFCADLREKKTNLPLLMVLEKSDALTRRLIRGKIECIDEDPVHITNIHEFVVKEGGLTEAEALMRGYLDKAREAIYGYRDTQYKTALLELCDFIADRDK